MPTSARDSGDVQTAGVAMRVAHLLVMAIALSASALALGVAADQLRCRGVSLSTSFAFATGFALLAQLSLVMSWPVPTWLPWIAISGVGAATVLSYAILAELWKLDGPMFPQTAASARPSLSAHQ